MKIRKKPTQINFRASSDFKQRLETAAAERGETLTTFIERSLLKELEREEKKIKEKKARYNLP